MAKEYAGTNLDEIRADLQARGFTEVCQDNAAKGFDLWRPFNKLPAENCTHVVVWPRKEGGGYWAEEY